LARAISGRRDLHDADEAGRVRVRDSLLGRGIAALDQDQGFQPVPRAVELFQAPDHAADHVLLLVGGDQDGVPGQLGVREGRRGLAGGAITSAATAAIAASGSPGRGSGAGNRAAARGGQLFNSRAG
jgi:hypothetical protein